MRTKTKQQKLQAKLNELSHKIDMLEADKQIAADRAWREELKRARVTKQTGILIEAIGKVFQDLI